MRPNPPDEVDQASDEPGATATEADAQEQRGSTSALPVAGKPSPEVAQHLRERLQVDDSRLGEVYRGLQRNLTAEQIAAELGVGTSNFVWN
jgi:hypothetical protein